MYKGPYTESCASQSHADSHAPAAAGAPGTRPKQHTQGRVVCPPGISAAQPACMQSIMSSRQHAPASYETRPGNPADKHSRDSGTGLRHNAHGYHHLQHPPQHGSRRSTSCTAAARGGNNHLQDVYGFRKLCLLTQPGSTGYGAGANAKEAVMKHTCPVCKRSKLDMRRMYEPRCAASCDYCHTFNTQQT
jgi:hypothetical protein